MKSPAPAAASGSKKPTSDELFDDVYDDLRHLAAFHFRSESPGHTLQPTAVVHEAFIRLADQRKSNWSSRAEFLGVASRMMRRIMVDYARAKHAKKRTGGRERVSLEEGALLTVGQPEAFLAVCEALDRLKELSARQGQIVELRFFGGLTLDEISEVTGLSPSTIERSWRVARAWLKRELSED